MAPIPSSQPGGENSVVALSFLKRSFLSVPKCEAVSGDCPVEALREALAREADLLDGLQSALREKDSLLQQQEILRSESDHRLLNGLQIVVSLLSLQGRAATDPEVERQLSVAANRVATIEKIHRRLHHNDASQSVAFKTYLEDFCEDFSAIATVGEAAALPIVVTGIDLYLPAKTAIPLGFIVNELITNAVKYGNGRISVGLERQSASTCMLAVGNDGPALPRDYNPEDSKGLGMKIVRSFTRQIGGDFNCGVTSAGPRFMVTFPHGA